MAEPPYDDRGADDSDAHVISTPPWVKVAGLVAIIVVVVMVVLLLIGGHGPGRHTLGDDQKIAGDRFRI